MIKIEIISSKKVVLPDETVPIPASIIINEDGIIEEIVRYTNSEIDPDFHMKTKYGEGYSWTHTNYGELVVSPGIIEMCVHMQSPEWEGVSASTRAAVSGGVTTILEMPILDQPIIIDTLSLRERQSKAEGNAHCDVGYAGGLHLNVPGAHIDIDYAQQIKELIAAGVLALRLYVGDSVFSEFQAMDFEKFGRIMDVSWRINRDIPVIIHCEKAHERILYSRTPYRKHKLQDRLLEQQILEDDISTGFGGAFPDPVSGNKLSDVDSDSESNESDSESPSSSAIPCTTYKTKLIESPLTNKKTEVENVGSENMKNLVYIEYKRNLRKLQSDLHILTKAELMEYEYKPEEIPHLDLENLEGNNPNMQSNSNSKSSFVKSKFSPSFTKQKESQWKSSNTSGSSDNLNKYSYPKGKDELEEMRKSGVEEESKSPKALIDNEKIDQLEDKTKVIIRDTSTKNDSPKPPLPTGSGRRIICKESTPQSAGNAQPQKPKKKLVKLNSANFDRQDSPVKKGFIQSRMERLSKQRDSSGEIESLQTLMKLQINTGKRQSVSTEVHSGYAALSGTSLSSGNSGGEFNTFRSLDFKHRESLQVINRKGEKYPFYLAKSPMKWEENAIDQLLSVIKQTNHPLVHITGVSSSKVLDKLTKEGPGMRITWETSPHYLFFSEKDIGVGQTKFKCNPPIRDEENRKFLVQCLAFDMITCISSEHFPMDSTYKCPTFHRALAGATSLGFTLQSMWTIYRENKKVFDNIICEHKEQLIPEEIMICQMSKWLSSRPARILNISSKKGSIGVGQEADLCIWDPKASYHVGEDCIWNKHKEHCLYSGRILNGKVKSTYLGGVKVFQESETAVLNPSHSVEHQSSLSPSSRMMDQKEAYFGYPFRDIPIGKVISPPKL